MTAENKCPICGHHSGWAIAFRRDAQVDRWRNEIGDHSAHNWRLCSQCSNAYPSISPDQRILQQIWDINRTTTISNGRSVEAIWAYRRAISRAGAERSFRLFATLAPVSHGRFLDIACGLGETVKTFADRGWDAEGIDADKSTAHIHRELGIRSSIGRFESTKSEKHYDIIHIAHAIYFISTPMEFLRSVRERLATGGVFCVVLADFMANDDPALPGYAHTFFPTGSSMRYALAKAGFETIFCKRQSGSIFIAARATSNLIMPFVWPLGILLLYRTKALRYAVIGSPYILARRVVRKLIGRKTDLHS
jgi:SAM-dependent methyltransferase